MVASIPARLGPLPRRNGRRPTTPAVVELYKVLWDSGQYEMALTSGRFERSRRLTKTWLARNEIPVGKI